MLIHPEVLDALADRRPVIALESTIISHGLPRPDNLRIAREIEAAVRTGGAVPATIAVVDGTARIGLDAAALARVAGDTVTPFLLDWFHRSTGGSSLAANVSLVLGNARLAVPRWTNWQPRV